MKAEEQRIRKESQNNENDGRNFVASQSFNKPFIPPNILNQLKNCSIKKDYLVETEQYIIPLHSDLENLGKNQYKNNTTSFDSANKELNLNSPAKNFISSNQA